MGWNLIWMFFLLLFFIRVKRLNTETTPETLLVANKTFLRRCTVPVTSVQISLQHFGRYIDGSDSSIWISGKQIHVTVDKTVVKQELRLLNLSADYRSTGFISPVPCKWSSRRLAGTSSSTCFSEPVCPSGKGRGWQAKGHNSVRTDLFLQQVLVHWHCLVVTLFLCC